MPLMLVQYLFDYYNSFLIFVTDIYSHYVLDDDVGVSDEVDNDDNISIRFCSNNILFYIVFRVP